MQDEAFVTRPGQYPNQSSSVAFSARRALLKCVNRGRGVMPLYAVVKSSWQRTSWRDAVPYVIESNGCRVFMPSALQPADDTKLSCNLRVCDSQAPSWREALRSGNGPDWTAGVMNLRVTVKGWVWRLPSAASNLCSGRRPRLRIEKGNSDIEDPH